MAKRSKKKSKTRKRIKSKKKLEKPEINQELIIKTKKEWVNRALANKFFLNITHPI